MDASEGCLENFNIVHSPPIKARTDLRNSDVKNAADRNFSNFAFYTAEVLTLTRNAINAMRISQV